MNANEYKRFPDSAVNGGINDAAGVLEVLTSHVGGAGSGITQICCLDMDLNLFENQYPVGDGMSYNGSVAKVGLKVKKLCECNFFRRIAWIA